MNQLTRQDIAEVVEEVLDRKLEKRFKEFGEEMDGKLEQQTDAIDTLDKKLNQRIDALDEKLERHVNVLDKKLERQSRALEEKLDRQTGVLAEYFDNKFDGLAEAIQVVNASVGSLARQSDLQAVQYDIKTIKIAVRATNDDLWR